MNRRRFMCKVVGLVGATGTLAATPGVLQQRQSGANIRSSGRTNDSLILERKPFTWPGGKTLAVWIAPNVEVWSFDSAVDAALSPNGGIGPDVITYGTRDYGIRVGLWRIADVLDQAAIKATVAINAAACEIYPRAVDEMKKRGWEFMAHGLTNSQSLKNLPIDQERIVIKTTIQTIEKAAGKKVDGWLSPGQSETSNTPDLLAEAGVLYTGDWNNDDQPYRMKATNGQLYSLPYCQAINDIDILSRLGLTGPQYLQSLVEQFETLKSDSRKSPRVMGIPLHPFLTGSPANIKYLKEALQHMKQAEGVWFATGSEIVEAYRKVE
jgi:peptidoglycan/xylan/chitin deacetylase (PgdA/CDA1 family)